jgi:hypothetical protein
MEERLTLPGGLSLRIAAEATRTPYPTHHLQRGLLLYDGEQELAEEGVGFGVPVLKRGVQTVFPGAVRLGSRAEGPVREIHAVFRLDLVERLAKARGGGVRPRVLYAAKDSLAALHRRVPVLRRPLTALSGAGRRALGWSTTYEPSAFRASVPVTYSCRESDPTVTITADLTGLAAGGVTEVVLMNELGAREFDLYEDANGASLRGDAIGTWDEVTAASARFVSTTRALAFSIAQAPGARLYRGRELVGSRLAWVGFGLSSPPAASRLRYDVRIEGPA